MSTGVPANLTRHHQCCVQVLTTNMTGSCSQIRFGYTVIREILGNVLQLALEPETPISYALCAPVHSCIKFPLGGGGVKPC